MYCTTTLRGENEMGIKGNFPPDQMGCWYCHHKDSDLVFSREWDSCVHIYCIQNAITRDPNDEEADIFARELIPGHVSKVQEIPWPCDMCNTGFPITADGFHYGTQALGMIPNTKCPMHVEPTVFLGGDEAVF